MFTKAERLISLRNLRPKKKEGFLKIISIFSFLGIMIGVAILIIVMSVMNGFRTDLTNKILGLNPHIVIQPNSFEMDNSFILNLKKTVLVPEEYLNPLYDDLNTPGFIAVLHKLYDKAKEGKQEDKEIFTTACKFIGLLDQSKEEWDSFKKQNLKLSEKDILKKIEDRNKARDKKDYELADKIRNELLDKGILIEDKDGKTTWKIK